MQRKLLGLLLLFVLLFAVASWFQREDTPPNITPCTGSPVMLTYQDRQAVYCLGTLDAASLIKEANVTGACQTPLLSLSPIHFAEHILLQEKNNDCSVERKLIPASQRFVLGIPLNINTASQEELEVLPGIGPSVAKAIVEDRSLNGLFASVEDLDRVKGIGPKSIEKLKPFVTVNQ